MHQYIFNHILTILKYYPLKLLNWIQSSAKKKHDSKHIESQKSLPDCHVISSTEAKNWRNSTPVTFCSSRNQEFSWGGMTGLQCQGKSLKTEMEYPAQPRRNLIIAAPYFHQMTNYDKQSNLGHTDDIIWLLDAFLYHLYEIWMSVGKHWHDRDQLKSMEVHKRNRKFERISLTL